MIRKSPNGFYIQNGNESLPVRIERYPFGEWLNSCFKALFAEKPEMSEIWTNPTFDASEKNRLIEEATEYYFLRRFASRFHVSYSPKGNWKIFNRKELSPLIPDNRILDLFTQPMEERPIFANIQRIENKVDYCVFNDSGDLIGCYDDNNFLLPKGSLIMKINKGLIIDTPVYNLRFRASCDGCSCSLPIDFAKYYLGFRKRTARNVDVQIEIHRKLNSYLFAKHRKLYKEMTEFIDHFEESISYHRFFDKYDWERMCIQSGMIELVKTCSFDFENFKKVSIEPGGGIAWYNGFDFCPNYLKEL